MVNALPDCLKTTLYSGARRVRRLPSPTATSKNMGKPKTENTKKVAGNAKVG